MSEYETKKAEIENIILSRKRDLMNDELFNIRRGLMSLELSVKEAELELDFYKVRVTAEQFPNMNPKLLELQIKKRELAVEIAKEELRDLQVKLEERLKPKPEPKPE